MSQRAVAYVELRFYCVMNPAELASKQQRVEVLFAETLPRSE